MLWIFLLYFIPAYNASVKMITHHRALMTCNSTEYSITETWRDCIELCAHNDSCVIAQTNLTVPKECQWCSIQNLMYIQKRFSANNNMIIALKTDTINEITESVCTPFEQGIVNGNFNNTSNLTQYKYSAQPSEDGNFLHFSYSAIKSCPSEWEPFDRIRGGWCIKVFRQGGSHDDAHRACKEYNAVLTRLETPKEMEYVWNTAYSVEAIFQKPSWEVYLETVWIDGVRKNECQVPNWKSIEGCDGLDGFEFEDKFISKKGGYTWSDKNPDRLDNVQDCLVLWINPNDKEVDDDACGSNAKIKGFACGKEAG